MEYVDRKVLESARQWYELASKGEIRTGDVFFRFVAVYVAFMALLTNRYPGIANEYDKVIKFSQEDKTRARHLELLEKDREYLSAVKTLKARPIYNMQRRRQEQAITDKEDLTQVLRDGTRVVRNNLFHAGKDPGNARDKDLVEASHKVVSRLIEPDLIGGT